MNVAKGKKTETEPEAEDHISAFDEKVEKLVQLASEAEFENGSLLGDVRDRMLEIFKNRPKAWSQMSEAEHRDIGKALENAAQTLIRRVVLVVAEGDEISVTGTLKGYSAKGGDFQLKVEAQGDDATALQLFKMDGHAVVIKSADASKLLGKKSEAEVIPDQAALAFSDEETPAEEVDLEAAAEPPAVESATEEALVEDEESGAATVE